MSTIYCRHIRPSGRRCQTLALRNKPFCYFHENVNAHLRTLQPPDDGTHNIIHPMNLDAGKFQREPILAEYFSHTRAPLELNFPPIEDADSIQVSLSMLLTALGQNRLEPRRASAMLYNLQIATSNVRNLTHNERHAVIDPVFDDTGNIMSPDEDPAEVLEAQLLEDYEMRDDDEDDDESN
jgi:hypothetical protein